MRLHFKVIALLVDATQFGWHRALVLKAFAARGLIKFFSQHKGFFARRIIGLRPWHPDGLDQRLANCFLLERV